VFRLGYNTNGFAHHRLEDALPILAELGYESVAITLDHYALNPFDRQLHKQMGEVRSWLETTGLKCVVETGARFLLDSREKHQPTLISPEPWQREYRFEFLARAVWIAASLGAGVVSFWSGTAVAGDEADVVDQRLVDGCRRLCDIADRNGLDLAFEPEPGMVVETVRQYMELAGRVDHPRFGLTIDIGHLVCNGEPVRETIIAAGDRLRNVHIEDARPGVHEHLMFGEGVVDFADAFDALELAGYAAGVHVELSRHSHDAVRIARRSIAFLRGVRERQPRGSG
jgi:sugar phosphate isomerase/epimerase